MNFVNVDELMMNKKCVLSKMVVDVSIEMQFVSVYLLIVADTSYTTSQQCKICLYRN